MRWVRCVACIKEMKNSKKFLVGKPQRKTCYERSRCGCENDSIIRWTAESCHRMVCGSVQIATTDLCKRSGVS